jgi:hypothetical protein
LPAWKALPSRGCHNRIFRNSKGILPNSLKRKNRKVLSLAVSGDGLKPLKLVLVLILGVAVEGTCACAESATNGSAFKGVSALVTEDTTCCSTEECSTESTTLGVRAGGSGAVAKRDAGNSGDG